MKADRRKFLKTASVIGVAASFPELLLAQTFSTPILTISSDAAGTPISPNFLGFSYETKLMTNKEYLTTENTSLLSLYALLGKDGVVRIGGNTSEYGMWNRTVSTSQPKQYALTDADVARTAAFVKATGWKCIYGLNLGCGNPSDAAEEAAVVAAAFGDSLIAFQIGNEPDLYSHNGLRPETYVFLDYLEEWQTYVSAVQARVPNARFAGPDTANSTEWVQNMATEDPSAVSFLSNHYYSEGPGSSPDTTIEKMLLSSKRLENLLGDMSSSSLAARKPFRMTETNSVYGGGRKGVSDTQAAAVWAIDLLMRVASRGGAGVNFHGGNRGAYSPVDVQDIYTAADTVEPARSTATAIFYALLMFASIGPGIVVPVRFADAPTGSSGYAVQGERGRLSIILVNSSTSNAARVGVDTGRAYSDSNVWRLDAPADDSVGCTTFGGAEIDENNVWNPQSRESVTFSGTTFWTTVPAVGAALISLH